VAVFTYVRDRIEISDALRDELAAEMKFRKITRGTTVCLLAREIVHSSQYTFALSGHPLILVADSYDGNGGAIDTATYNLFGPAAGAPAHDTTPGGNGANGASASPITVVAQKVVNARLVARGRPGGKGGDAADGADGSNARRGEKIGGSVECFPGRPGRDGGRGGTGGTGGDGGNVAIYFMTSQGDLVSDTGPGAGGKGGAKGTDGQRGADAGGRTCPGGEAGKGGAAGANGQMGTPGTVTKSAVSDADAWWQLVVDLAGKSAAIQWSNYRTGVGEYLFRSYVPATMRSSVPSLAIRTPVVDFEDYQPIRFDPSIFRPTKASLLAKARKELESALILSAKVNGRQVRTIYNPLYVNNRRAKVLLDYINRGVTPIGIGYQHDLRPDFEFYEEFITDYQGHKDSLFGNTLQTLLNIEDKADKSYLAKAARDHAQGMAGAAQIDATLAESQRQAAEVAWEKAKGRLYAIQQALVAIKEARENEADISFGDVVKGIGVVVGAVIAVVGAVQSAGTTVAAWLAAVGALASTASAAGAAADNLETWVDLSNPADPKLTAAGQKVKGSLTDAIDKTVLLVDKVEAVAQLFAAQGDDEFDERERQLLIDAFDAAYEVNMRFIDHEQARLAAESAQQKAATYAADTEALSTIAAGFEKDVAAVTRVARILIRQFQDYLDYFLWYGFRRDRAFDLYTLAVPPRAPRFRFDYGYLHPDLEEDAFFALGRGDAARVLDLVDAYVKSLALFDPAALREEYDDYWNHLGFEGHVAVPITDSVALDGLKGSRTVSFDVPISAFTPSTELKIGRAEVALIGAKVDPNHNWVQIELEHCGDATNLRQDGTAVVIKAPPRRELSPAQVLGINPDDLDERSNQQFWGRSPAARWRIRIPEEAAAAAGLDLGGLSQIQLAIKFSYYVRAVARNTTDAMTHTHAASPPS
jgi:hypothetical protein